MDLNEYRAFLAAMGIDSSAPSAASLGFPGVTEEQVEVFRVYLTNSATAGRVRKKILPNCDRVNLSRFLILVVHPGIEAHFLEDKKRRGQKVQTALRQRARHGGDAEMLRRAGPAFSTRRMGLGENWSLLLVVREYIRYRAGVKLRPVDWAALLGAAYEAAGRPAQAADVDGERISRNVRRFARSHLIPPGPQAAKIIEIPRPRAGSP